MITDEIDRDTLNEANKDMFESCGQDYPREIGEISFVGDIHFKRKDIAREKAEEKVLQDYETFKLETGVVRSINAEYLNLLDEGSVFE